jgi:hypothetical protein
VRKKEKLKIGSSIASSYAALEHKKQKQEQVSRVVGFIALVIAVSIFIFIISK